ncbi:permease prefix domain 1-containing protein [Kribbella sp. CA-293567]|uniref:permease prefix domain 1-containing protein n=1 Tax=Kribbella sp. CA-293567 TaxID=3002436 RepID=UPI0022DD70CA|nr:permease prefix domain 1-containing protein [Kribbella sp. CA-293567]WBQ05515.1 permease prefix domain 1-containing protein [Kribbella sp. CA-293567]
MSSHRTVLPDPVDVYLTGLSRALRGPRRRKADLLAEARDSLIDATEAFEAGGLSPRVAAERAVEDFGDLTEVVPGYRSELAIAQGRRTAVLLVLVMLAQPIVWLEGTWSWTQHADSGVAVVTVLNDLVQAVGMMSIAGSVLALIASGVGLRFPAVRERATRVIARFALTSCVAVSGIAVLLATASSATEGTGAQALLVVGAFVVVPLLLVSRSAHLCLRLA